MEKKLLLIYNPVSGKALIKTYLADIIDIYRCVSLFLGIGIILAIVPILYGLIKRE